MVTPRTTPVYRVVETYVHGGRTEVAVSGTQLSKGRSHVRRGRTTSETAGTRLVSVTGTREAMVLVS